MKRTTMSIHVTYEMTRWGAEKNMYLTNLLKIKRYSKEYGKILKSRLKRSFSKVGSYIDG